jgi:flagellar biosynthesis GTPase FlhF
MKRPAWRLGLVLFGGLLCTTQPILASALDDLKDAAGQGLPDVPTPSGPTRVDDSDDRESSQESQNAQNNENQRQEQLRQKQAEQARQEELHRQQEEEQRQEQLRQKQAEIERQEKLRRQREEKERQEKLRREQAAVAARAHWSNDDKKNANAFDDVFADPSCANTNGDASNAVDLTDATKLVPTILRGAGARVSLRIKPPPLPEPESTVASIPEEPEFAPPPKWRVDWDGKLRELGFAYASMYLKSKVEGLASIPELAKDSLNLKKKLNAHVSQYLERVFSTAGQVANPNADVAALADQTWSHFQTAAADIDEDARSGIQNNLGTTSGGAVPEDSPAGAGIGIAQTQVQDTAEVKKWAEAREGAAR